MKTIWRYINYDIIDTCLLTLSILLMIKCIISEWYLITPYILVAIAFPMIYISAVILRLGVIKDRLTTGYYKISILPWIFFTIWTGTFIYFLFFQS